MNILKKTRFASLLTFFFLLVCLSVIPVHAQSLDAKLLEVAPNLYMVTGLDGGNVAFLVTDEGVLVVDSTTLPATGELVVKLIKEKTDKPIKYLVFTHYHSDHTYGINGFPADISLVGHKNVGKNIETFNAKKIKDNIENRFPAHLAAQEKKVAELKKQLEAGDNPDLKKKLEKAEEQLKLDKEYLIEFKRIKIKTPTETFETKKTIKLGKQTIELIYPTPCHTDGNCLVYFPQLKAIHMGDILFHESFPYIDFKAGSNTESWIKCLKEVQKWDVTKVIPGHGNLTDKSGLEKMATFLADLRKEVAEAMKKELPLDKVKTEVKLEAYKDLKWGYLRPICVEAVYNELSGKK